MQSKNIIRGLFLKAISYKLKAGRQGFALIELLVAVSLFGIISTAVIFAYDKVSGQLFVTTLAYELALSFRQAQSYGVSVHQFKEGDPKAFDVGYGLHFDLGDPAKKTYILFGDQGGVSGDAKFNGSFGVGYDATGCQNTPTNPECVNVFRLEKGNTIRKFCGVLAGDKGRDVDDKDKSEECSVDSTPPGNPPPLITSLDVTFLRPDPDAIIRTSRSVGGAKYKAARVYIISPTGVGRVIEVVNTGQISIK